MSKLKLMVFGYGRHGKDTVCEILRDDFGYDFMSSSEFAAEKVMFPLLKDKYGYKTVEECFADRHNKERECRKQWYEGIMNYNIPDRTKLAREMYEIYPIYCGIRNREEFLQMDKEGLYDFSIWVDASERVEFQEDTNSCTVTSDLADFILDNNGSLEDLKKKVGELMYAMEEIKKLELKLQDKYARQTRD